MVDYWRTWALALVLSLAATVLLAAVVHVGLPGTVHVEYTVEVSRDTVEYVANLGSKAVYHVGLYYPLKPGEYSLLVYISGPDRRLIDSYELMIIVNGHKYACFSSCKLSLRTNYPFILADIYILPKKVLSNNERLKVIVTVLR